jgi:hypothetical protein
MSEHFQSKKGDLTGSGLQELAQLVCDQLPDGAVVAAASVGLRFDSAMGEIVMDEAPEIMTASKHPDGPLAVLAVRLEERLHHALDEAAANDSWAFDVEHNPVLLFSVESDCDYYMLVAVAVDVDDPVEINETKLIGEIIQYIDDNAPTADFIEESEPSVCYVFGVLTNPSCVYCIDFEGQDCDDE